MDVGGVIRMSAAKITGVFFIVCYITSLGITQVSPKCHRFEDIAVLTTNSYSVEYTTVSDLDTLLSDVNSSLRPIRFCVVASRDSNVPILQHCADLASAADSDVICDDPAPDRLTCLRRLIQDHTDFTTLYAEDLLVAAKIYSENITVTSELRMLEKQRYEYEMAVVVRNSANITNVVGLRNATLCHPGYGYETDWNGHVSRFLESRVIPQICDPALTLTENSLFSSASFFRAACKAGPWVPDQNLDAELKSRYPNLCAICDNSRECSIGDKYWGRNGPLYCLTDGAGDVLWARLDHIKLHFAPEDPDSQPEENMADFSFLCPNFTQQPVDILQSKKLHPCVWLSRPWPVVVAHRLRAAVVKKLMRNLTRAEPNTWQSTLGMLVAPFVQHIHSASSGVSTDDKMSSYIHSVNDVEDRLNSAPGWLDAATVKPCSLEHLTNPRLCVSEKRAISKCVWLMEAAKAHGLRGVPRCVQPIVDCLSDVAADDADLAIVNSDSLYLATSKHQLKVLLYEQPKLPEQMYLASAVVTDTNIRSLSDLRNKRACFPTYKGASWQLTMAALKTKQFVANCSEDEASLLSFFSSVCVAHNSSGLHGKVPLCFEDIYNEDCDDDYVSKDMTALRCLTEGRGDVAFVSKSSAKLLENTSHSHHPKQAFSFACFLNQRCEFGWTPHGMLVTRNTESGVKMRQWRTMFEQLDEMFGPRHHAPVTSILMYGPYDNQTNLLFHNSTYQLVNHDTLSQDMDIYGPDLTQVLRESQTDCLPSVATHLAVSLGPVVVISWLLVL